MYRDLEVEVATVRLGAAIGLVRLYDFSRDDETLASLLGNHSLLHEVR